MEYIDVYDENRNFLNKVVKRCDTLGEKEFRLAVSVLVINKNDEILTTLRSSQKSSYPNKWENTTGGVVSGEDMISACIRELYEETGIVAKVNEFSKIAEFISGDLLFDTFVLFKDVKLEDIKLDEKETVDARFVSIEEFDRMIEEGMVLEPQGQVFKDSLREILDELITVERKPLTKFEKELENELNNKDFCGFRTFDTTSYKNKKYENEILEFKQKYRKFVEKNGLDFEKMMKFIISKVDVIYINAEEKYRLQCLMCKSNAFNSLINEVIKIKEEQIEIIGFEIIRNEKSERYFKELKGVIWVLIEKNTLSIFTNSNKLEEEFNLNLGLPRIESK